jgi:RimJ/RimL family protein N-acetyltransferase
MAEMVAETQRLRLREWDEADVEPFYRVMNTPEVLKYLGGVQSPQQWRAAAERLFSYQREFGFTFWIVEEKASGRLLGWCGLKRINYPGAPNPGDMEIGWRYRPDAWGTGIAKEAAIAALDLAFDRFDAPFVVADTTSENTGSWGLMERLGMTYQPHLDFVDQRFDPPIGVSKQWRIDAADWPAARAAALAPRRSGQDGLAGDLRP